MTPEKAIEVIEVFIDHAPVPGGTKHEPMVAVNVLKDFFGVNEEEDSHAPES